MWLKISLLSVLLLIGSCSRGHIKVVSIDPAFQGYVDDFISDGASVGYHVVIDDLVIQFTSGLTSETLGECRLGNAKLTPLILIDIQDWPLESIEYQRVVLYHELGHCVLNRQHVFTGTILQNYCSPTSIMYPYILNNTYVYSDNWTWYVQEMFYYPSLDITSQATGNYCAFN